MNLSDEHKQYLAYKHRGGLNNQKGNTFEEIYATKEIIRLFADLKEWEDTTVTCQVENVFVDDFRIVYPNGLITYHQCKDTQVLSWKDDERGKPLYDFKWQKSYSSANNENFKLKIVYSDSNCGIHSEPIPNQIKDVTEKELFHSHPTLTAFINNSDEICNYIKKVSQYTNGSSSLDELLAFAEIIRSQWQEMGTPNKEVSLSAIRNSAEAMFGGIINFRDKQDVSLPNDLKFIFQKFPEFSYSVAGNRVNWIFRNMTGVFVPAEDIINRIISQNPDDIFELISLLN